MAEFLSVLSFSMVPLVMLLLFSIITPPLGATLSLRNEILLGIALPPMGSAIIAAAIVAGVQSESTIALYGITALLLFLLMIVLPLGAAQGRISLRRRELVLAGLFCIGNAVTMLLMGISPLAEAHFRSLLQGELLAVSMAQLWAVAAACGLLLFALVRFRGALYAYALDEEGLFIREQ
jgi:ABC-type Mn2+/Zn2+ transport system permease subunit